MNEVLDSFFKRLSLAPWEPEGTSLAGFSPRVEVVEKDDRIAVKAELPGLDEKDIDVALSDDALTIKGERKQEKEERDESRHYHRKEISYGSFLRTIPLPHRVEADKVKATFKKGVLRIELPIRPEERTRTHKIAVRPE